MTHVDPFATATVSPEEEGMQAVDVPVTVQSAPGSSEAVSATLKAHGGHDAPWLVFKGPNVAAVKEMLQDAVQSELMDDVAAAAKTFSSVVPASSGGGRPAAKPAATQQSYSAPAAPAAAATKRFTPVQGDSCAHGQLVFDEWTNPKTQKTSRAYKCPLKVANWRDPNACDAIKWAG